MDICVVTFRNTADRIVRCMRPRDELWVRDNTINNIGFAAAANELAGRGTQEVILFVNPDGDPLPGCLDALEQVLHDNESVVAVEASQGPGLDRPLNARAEPEWVSGACFAVRRSVFENLCGFDERLYMYCEDVDLSIRLARVGRLAHCSTARFQHDQGRKSIKSLHRNFRNWLIVQRRYGKANPTQMLRDASYSIRQRRYREGLVRISGVIDYLVRGRHWASHPRLRNFKSGAMG